MKKVTTLALAAALALGLAAGAHAAALNEAVMNDSSTDDHEFIEICGQPSESLDGLTLVVIEGEGAATGLIDVAIDLSGYMIGATGYFVVGDAAVSPDLLQPASWIENGGQTMLLVRDFTAAVGQDVDADDDGVADGPIGIIVDGVGVAVPASGDFTYYGVPTLGPDTGDTGGSNFDVAGVVRCADCTGDWGMICLNGTEPTGPGCDITNPFNPYLVPFASPGSANLCPPVAVEPESWGKIKADYR